MNKTLQEYLDSPEVGVYEKAKAWYDKAANAMKFYYGTEASQELEHAVDILPHEGEVSISMRFKKDLIRTDSLYAELVSTLFDFVEQVQASMGNLDFYHKAEAESAMQREKEKMFEEMQ